VIPGINFKDCMKIIRVVLFCLIITFIVPVPSPAQKGSFLIRSEKRAREARRSADVYFDKQQYDKAPILIPIYFHRYIPSEPYEKGNPVYSVHQTDIIYYGENLESYFQIQFGKGRQEEMKHKNIKEIRFWRDIVS
jgi:hypothetical protein